MSTGCPRRLLTRWLLRAPVRSRAPRPCTGVYLAGCPAFAPAGRPRASSPCFARRWSAAWCWAPRQPAKHALLAARARPPAIARIRAYPASLDRLGQRLAAAHRDHANDATMIRDLVRGSEGSIRRSTSTQRHWPQSKLPCHVLVGTDDPVGAKDDAERSGLRFFPMRPSRSGGFRPPSVVRRPGALRVQPRDVPRGQGRSGGPDLRPELDPVAASDAAQRLSARSSSRAQRVMPTSAGGRGSGPVSWARRTPRRSATGRSPPSTTARRPSRPTARRSG